MINSPINAIRSRLGMNSLDAEMEAVRQRALQQQAQMEMVRDRIARQSQADVQSVQANQVQMPRSEPIQPMRMQQPEDTGLSGIGDVLGALGTGLVGNLFRQKPKPTPAAANQFAGPEMRRLTRNMNPNNALSIFRQPPNTRNQFAGFARGGRWQELLKRIQDGETVAVGEEGMELINKDAGVIPAPTARQILNTQPASPMEQASRLPVPQMSSRLSFNAPDFQQPPPPPPSRLVPPGTTVLDEPPPVMPPPGRMAGLQEPQPVLRPRLEPGQTVLDEAPPAMARLSRPPVQAMPQDAQVDSAVIPAPSRADAVSNAANDRAAQPVQANNVTYEGRASMPEFEPPVARLTESAPSSPESSPASARRAQLEQELVKLYQLENTRAVDKNGKLKSTFLGILQGFLRGGVGGAAAGGIYAGVHSQWDEELKQVAQVRQQNGKVGRALKIESELARLDVMGQHSANNAAKLQRDEAAKRDAQKAKDRTELAGIISKYYPKGAPVDGFPMEIVNRAKELSYPLGMIPERAPYSPPAIGSPQNRPTVATPGQVVLVSDGKGGMKQLPVSDLEGKPAPPMTEYQKKQLELEAQRNAQFAGRGGGRGRGYSRHSSGRGGSRGGGGGGLDKFEQGRLDKYENEAAQARARAASLHSRGEDGSAELEAARVADQTASRLKARQGGRGGRGAPSTASPRRGDPLGILN
jgi:hypothetical protein